MRTLPFLTLLLLGCPRASSSLHDPSLPLLPDLVSWEAKLRDAEISHERGRRLLRFSAAAANRGLGPLEMQARVADDGTTEAYQVVHYPDGTRSTLHVGTFIFHDHASHNHWHFDDFARYELRRRDTDEIVASSGKVSFCLMDYMIYGDEDVGDRPPRAVYSCAKQGISVGWADLYASDLDGQFIDVTGIRDGEYRLVVTIDPAGRLRETATWNNTGYIDLRIDGDEVEILP
jgi:hypothetical protein